MHTPTLEDVERFRNGSVRELHERSLYERISEPMENHAISKLSNVDLNKHLCKHRRGFRRDREPSRIPKRLRNKSRKVRKVVHEDILSCIPRSSTVCCCVNVRRQQNKTKFLFNCCGRIRQGIRKLKYRASGYLSLFSCNRLMCPCKSETHARIIANIN